MQHGHSHARVLRPGPPGQLGHWSKMAFRAMSDTIRLRSFQGKALEQTFQDHVTSCHRSRLPRTSSLQLPQTCFHIWEGLVVAAMPIRAPAAWLAEVVALEEQTGTMMVTVAGLASMSRSTGGSSGLARVVGMDKRRPPASGGR